MPRTFKSTTATLPIFENPLDDIRKNQAKAMVGSSVELLADSQTVRHGIVTGVFMMSGTPKILVNGRTYDLHQVVTAIGRSIG